jgi:hypothetical protein
MMNQHLERQNSELLESINSAVKRRLDMQAGVSLQLRDLLSSRGNSHVLCVAKKPLPSRPYP